MFFSMFPKMLVTTITPNTTTLVTDIFRRISLNKFKNNIVFLQTITVPDGFTIEQVSDKFYNNPDYHWVIITINEIIDIRKEWPIGDSDLISFCKKKYGVNGIYLPHHHRTTDEFKIIVDFDEAGLANGDIEIVSNYAYEEELNNSKREIKMLEPQYLAEFVSLYSNLISR